MVSKNFNIRPESICRFSLFYRHIFSRAFVSDSFPFFSLFSFLFLFFLTSHGISSRRRSISRNDTNIFISAILHLRAFISASLICIFTNLSRQITFLLLLPFCVRLLRSRAQGHGLCFRNDELE